MTSALGALLGPLGMLVFLLLASIFAVVLHSLWRAVNSLQVHRCTHTHRTCKQSHAHCTHASHTCTAHRPHTYSTEPSLCPLTAEEEGNIHPAHTTHAVHYHIPHIAHTHARAHAPATHTAGAPRSSIRARACSCCADATPRATPRRAPR